MLLVINAAVPAIGGIVLFVWPGFVPGTVGIAIGSEQRLLAYLIGAAEFSFATLCVLALRNSSREVRQIVAVTAIVFHGAAGAATLLSWLGGTTPLVLVNTAARIAMVAAFAALGLKRPGWPRSGRCPE